MADFTAVRSFVYVSGNLIDPAQNNGNENEVYNKHNGAMNGTTGHTHDGTTGNGAPIVLQNSVPTVTRQLGFGATRLQYYDGTAARLVMATAVANTIITGGSVDFAAIANSLLLPSGTPSVSRSAAIINNQLNIYDGSTPRIYVPVDKVSFGIHNLGLKLSAGAISITGLGNTALAATNAAWISYPSATAGVWLSQTVIADQTIASGGIKGQWGTTSSVAWGSDMPFAIGVTSSDNTAANIRFFLTRNPAMVTTPANTNNIGIDGTAPVTSSKDNIVLFGSAANTGYNSRPCRIIGSCRMTCDNSAGGVWTVTALDNGDGIGNFYNYDAREFTMPVGQNGAKAGIHFFDTATNEPAFTTTTYTYFQNRLGYINGYFLFNGDAGTDGTGAGLVELSVPATPFKSDEHVLPGGLNATFSAGGSFQVGHCFKGNGDNFVTFRWNISTTGFKDLANQDYTNGSRTLSGSYMLKVF